MRMLVAFDSFKGAASSKELNQAFMDGARTALPEIVVEEMAVGDGGEGTVVAIHAALGGEFFSVPTVDLLGRAIEAKYLLVQDRAFIETAEVVGLHHVSSSESSFLESNSYGLGALLLDAVHRGAETIYLCLGGSGSSDGGMGLFQSLDFDPLTGATLYLEALKAVTLIGLTDVSNPYHGPKGYSFVFGPQKGGTAQSIASQDEKARRFSEEVYEKRQIDLQAIAGTGAAGGLGGAIILLGGRLQNGLQTIIELLDLETHISSYDVLITGEGRCDQQSLEGKVPIGLARFAGKFAVPTVLVAGSLDLAQETITEEFLATYPLNRELLPLEKAMSQSVTLDNMFFAGYNVTKLLSTKL